MDRYEVAQLNVGRAVAPFDDAVMADFMNWLDEINALAERSPGFVWRLQGDNGNNTSLKVSDDPLFIINMSVWSSIDALYEFTYRSEHKTVFKRRHEWFERMGIPITVLWWLPAGTVPSVDNALARLERLRSLGPTPDAFTFKQHFPPPSTNEDVAPAPAPASVVTS
jgi:hypothetical protein